jgi:EmrB/QacA subfamily drug resistance transporter
MSNSSRALSLTVAAALCMENMDGTIIATSLPAIAADLGTHPVSLKLAFTTYLLSLTVFLPLSGWVADRFGAKNIFRLAIIVFTVASVMCGYAQSLAWLVGARAAQGLGGALMVPVGRIILMRAVPKSELVEAIAWLTMPALIGPLIGPPLGGFITTYFDWRWIFWLNVPFGVLGLILASVLMPGGGRVSTDPFDMRGFLLSSVGLSSAVFGLTVAGRGLIGGPAVVALIVIGILLMWLYVRHARSTVAPILDISLLQIPTYRAGVLGGSLYRVGAGAIPFLLPLLLQLGFGFSSFRSGLVTCASAFGAIMMKAGAGPMIKRFGFRKLLIFNCALSCVLMALSAMFQSTTPLLLIYVILIFAAFFRSLQFTAMHAMSFADLENEAMSRATSLYTMAQQLSIAAGVACAAYVLDASLWWRGGTDLIASDFSIAFAVVSLISMVSIFQFFRLPEDAGATVSSQGH